MNKVFQKITTTNILLISLIGIFSPIAYSGDSKIADKYMQAYAKFDLKALATFYSEDAIFADPTSEMWGEYAYNMNGKKQILERMDSFLSQYDKASATYNVKTKYESAGHTVYTGKAKFSLTKEDVLQTSCMLITTVISVKEGKVTAHRDYIDYDNLESSKKVGDQVC